jgi:hypothetical protein
MVGRSCNVCRWQHHQTLSPSSTLLSSFSPFCHTQQAAATTVLAKMKREKEGEGRQQEEAQEGVGGTRKGDVCKVKPLSTETSIFQSSRDTNKLQRQRVARRVRLYRPRQETERKAERGQQLLPDERKSNSATCRRQRLLQRQISSLKL